jgi:hypothetical protein
VLFSVLPVYGSPHPFNAGTGTLLHSSLCGEGKHDQKDECGDAAVTKKPGRAGKSGQDLKEAADSSSFIFLPGLLCRILWKKLQRQLFSFRGLTFAVASHEGRSPAVQRACCLMVLSVVATLKQ